MTSDANPTSAGTGRSSGLPQQRLERYARLVADIADAPICLISTVDGNCQHIMGAYGAELRTVDRTVAPVDEVFASGWFEARDLQNDRKNRHHPLAHQPPWVRFYAGIALRGPDGHAFGVLSVMARDTGSLSDCARRQMAKVAELLEAELTSFADGAGAPLNAGYELELPGTAMLEQYGDAWLRKRGDHESVLAMHVHVSNLEAINRAYGHAIGDTVLTILARRAEHAMPRSALVGRLPGARLSVVMKLGAGDADPNDAVKPLVDALEQPTEVAPEPMWPKLHVGVAVGPGDAQTGRSLIDGARRAAEKAGDDDADETVWFDAGADHAAGSRRARIPFRLSHALAQRDFVMAFQPIRELRDAELVAMEVLVRWHDTALGRVWPDSFMPHVEDDPQMARAMSRQVLEAACAQAVKYGRRGPEISVNVAAADIFQPDFEHFVLDILDKAGLERDRLILEITERGLVTDLETAARKLNWLAERGVQSALDDFGAGYASLSYLRYLPVQYLKLDRSLVSGIHADATGRTLTEGVVSLAHSLGLNVVAEGIETAEELAQMRAIGCARGQGYLIGPPMAASGDVPWRPVIS